MTRKVLPTVVFVVLLAGWTSLAASDDVCIAAAKRYQAVQIPNEHVLLQEQDLQQFVQSDVFRRIATDKKFLRAAWAQKVVFAALGDIDLGRVRYEISEYPPAGLWRVELERVFLELDGEPSPCSPCRR